jgi:hypothetical protein
MTPADWYSADLPQNAIFQQEIHRWSTFRQDLKDKPSPYDFLLAIVLYVLK